MVAATTSYPRSTSSAAATELSTPPDMATRTRSFTVPPHPSAECGMRNAEYKGRVESRNETRAAIPHSAFRTPHLGGVVKVLMAGGGTGGHLMPALALAQALRDAGKGIEPVLVGAERGIEAQVLPRYPFRHHLLPMEPIYRRTWWN